MASERGFTLIEMIVVLVIASMALMLGFQSLTQWQHAQDALTRVTASNRSLGLVESWWRASATSETAVLDSPFKGSTDSFQGFSISPVFGTAGATTETVWRLRTPKPDGDGILLELEEGGQQHLFELSGVRSARFSYVSGDGRTSDQWPMTLGKGEEDTNLPALIQLSLEGDDGQPIAIWVAAVSGPLDPVYKPAKMEDDW